MWKSNILKVNYIWSPYSLMERLEFWRFHQPILSDAIFTHALNHAQQLRKHSSEVSVARCRPMKSSEFWTLHKWRTCMKSSSGVVCYQLEQPKWVKESVTWLAMRSMGHWLDFPDFLFSVFHSLTPLAVISSKNTVSTKCIKYVTYYHKIHYKLLWHFLNTVQTT